MRLIRSTVVLGLAILVTLVPAIARADTYVHADPSGDVVSIKKATGATTAAPDQVEGDVVKTRVRHAAHRVILKMHVRELTKSGRGAIHYYAIRTKHLTRSVVVEATSGHWRGKVTVFKPNGKRAHCHVRRKIDYAANWARISVPRSCLDTPRWVRAAMEEITISATKVVYADDAHTVGQIYNRPVYGPRVRR